MENSFTTMTEQVKAILLQLQQDGPNGSAAAKEALKALGLPSHLAWALVKDALDTLVTPKDV